MGKVTEIFSLLVAVFGAVIISACNIPGSTLLQVFGNYVTIGVFLFPLTFILFDLNTYFFASNISSIIGQALDSVVFASIVLSVGQIIDSALAIFIIKALFGVMLTPILYVIKPIIKNQTH